MEEKSALSAIEALWKDYSSAAFPKGLAGQEIAGICVTSLDTFAAGCISTFLSKKGKLDLSRTAVLGLCYRDLSLVVAGLDGERREYFAGLEKVARMVLEAVRDEGIAP
jgi:hypothetical protein